MDWMERFFPFSFSEKYFPHSKMKPQLKLETNEILLFLSFCRKKTLLHQLEPSIKNSFERVEFFLKTFLPEKTVADFFIRQFAEFQERNRNWGWKCVSTSLWNECCCSQKVFGWNSKWSAFGIFLLKLKCYWKKKEKKVCEDESKFSNFQHFFIKLFSCISHFGIFEDNS